MCTEKYYSKNFDINNVSNLVLIGSIKNKTGAGIGIKISIPEETKKEKI